MKLQIIPHELCVCRLSSVTDADLSCDFYFMAKTDEEISLVCPSDSVPKRLLAREDGWRAFRLESPLDFSLTGVLSPIASLLAAADVPIFAVSTFNTDYILVKSENLARAASLLSDAGYEIEAL